MADVFRDLTSNFARFSDLRQFSTQHSFELYTSTNSFSQTLIGP